MPEYQVRAANLPDDPFIRGYLECAEWCGIDDEERDDFEGTIDPVWDAESLKRAQEDCEGFQRDVEQELGDKSGFGDRASLAGHDFWLTRNGHGAGFWDGDWTNGQTLTNLCKPYGECNVDFQKYSGEISFY